MAIVTGDRYVEKLQKFLEEETESLLEETIVLKLNPAGLHYIHLRLDSLRELERMLSGAPVDYLRAYVSDLGDYRALEQLRRILRILTSVKVVSTLPSPARDPTPLSLIPFGRLKVLELRGCDLSTSPAKGLLELRHTLEKIICHNSTVSYNFVIQRNWTLFWIISAEMVQTSHFLPRSRISAVSGDAKMLILEWCGGSFTLLGFCPQVNHQATNPGQNKTIKKNWETIKKN